MPKESTKKKTGKTKKKKSTAKKKQVKKEIKELKSKKPRIIQTKKVDLNKKNNLESWVILGVIIILIGAIIFIAYKGYHLKNSTSKEEVLAVVNDQKLTKPEFQKEYDFFFFIQGIPLAYKAAISKDAILNQTINEMLLLQYAKKLGITTSESEADALINKVAQMSNLSITNITEILAARNFTMDDLKEYYVKSITLNKLINRTILPKVNVTDAEIEQFYKNKNITTPYNETKDKIREALIKEKEMELLNSMIKDLRARSVVKINKSVLKEIR